VFHTQALKRVDSAIVAQRCINRRSLVKITVARIAAIEADIARQIDAQKRAVTRSCERLRVSAATTSQGAPSP
jgi:hypothetical protein